MPLGITFGAGQRLVGSDLMKMVAQIDSLTAPGWTAYTPVWTTSGTAPSLGNGSLSGRYRRAANADIVKVEFRLTCGSTTTYGTGTWFFSPPLTPSATAILNEVGALYILDSGVLDKSGTIKFENAAQMTPITATQGVVTNTIPQTWANGDIIRGEMSYEIA